MTFLAPLAAPLVTAGATALASKFFGPKAKPSGLDNFAPAGINAGGLRSSFDPGSGLISITPSAERMGLIGRTAGLFSQQADATAGLRARVAPGVSDLRRARLDQIDSSRESAIGNLRDNLARRRVLGSSFGQDALTRAESEFAGQREQVAAESFLQEFEMTTQMIGREFDLRRSEFTTQLDELNLEANLAATLTKGATEQLGANARLKAEMEAKRMENAGAFFSKTWGPVFSGIGKAVGGVVGG